MAGFMDMFLTPFQDWCYGKHGDDSLIPLEFCEDHDDKTHETISGFGCHYSAQGYMDQTEWRVSDSAVEAVKECWKMDGSGDRDWREKFRDDRDECAQMLRLARGFDRDRRI